MNKKIIAIEILFCSFLLINTHISYAQDLLHSPQYIQRLTAEWKGERSADGRPKVADALLDRLQKCTLEQVWGYLNRKGYRNQVANDWVILKPEEVMVGRVVTTQFMPSRPDLDSVIRQEGKAEGRSVRGTTNTWPIDILQKGDVYVADGFGKIKDGTLIGSSLGNAVYGRTGKGVIFFGSIRDMEELKNTQGFNAWIKGHHPSYIKDMTPVAINGPIRIDEATVIPGDVVFANAYGVIFIPAHLVEPLVVAAEMTSLRDEFERFLLQQAKYPSGQVHGTWSEKIKDEFRAWLRTRPGKLTVSEDQIETFLKKDE